MKNGMKTRCGLVAALAMAAGASVSSATVWEFNWYQYGAGSATYSSGTGPFWTGLKTTGPDAGSAGSHAVEFVAPVAMDIALVVNYSSTDIGTWDSCFYAINGVKTQITNNANQGTFLPSFSVQAGDFVTVGVTSADGTSGAGVVDITSIEPRQNIGFNGFNWHYFSLAGGGSGTFPPPAIIDVGGNNGVEDRNDVYTTIQGPATITISGNYSSGDSGNWDQGFDYVYEGSVVYTSFIQNSTQGNFNNHSIATGGGQPGFNGEFGWGVYTIDGNAGAGTLTIPTFNAVMLTAWMNDLPFFLSSGPGGAGSIAGGGFGVMTIDGGNNGNSGTTSYIAGGFGNASNDYIVQARATYTATDTSCWDSAVFIVDGVETTIACNDSPGTYNLSFAVKKGQSFGFGVSTADGLAGAGKLVIDSLRCFQVDSPDCYADCDGDSFLSIDDFICFQTTFALGDPFADCDGDTLLTIDDFICFQTSFAIGC